MRRLLALAIATLSFVAACSADSSTGTSETASVVGTWKLQTISGAPLPVTVTSSVPGQAELTGMTVTMIDGGGFNMTTAYRVTQGTQVTNSQESSTGTYVQLGSTITMYFNGGRGGSVSGTVTKTTLSLSEGSSVYQFSR